MTHRVAVLDKELCQPKKCGLECIKYCPVNKSGADCIVLNEETKKAQIDEDICNGCGICVKVCPFEAITIVNLATELATDKIHQYGQNSFRLYKLPTPKKGEVIGLLGRNGMGKTTTIKSICGILKPHSGKIEFNSVKINGMESYKIARLGVGLVPEGRRIFANLTVKENLIGSSIKGYWDLDKILTLFPIFEERLSQLSSNLSGGEQQMLAIGRALMTNPSLLILDEATEGLSPVISKKIWNVLREVSNKGISILIIDKISQDLKEFSNYSYILERGKSVWNGKLAELSSDNSKRFLGV